VAPSQALDSALEQRAALDLAPTVLELAQATKALDSAREQRAALDVPPNATELNQAQTSLISAKASLATALSAREQLAVGASATVLMFGDVPVWREFHQGMTPGVDIQQLERNLVSMGFATADSLLVDQLFDSETGNAVKEWQKSLELVPTGRIVYGDLVFLPGTSVVESSSSFPDPGITVSPTISVVSLMPTERISIDDSKDDQSVDIETLQRVRTTIEVSDKDLVNVGSNVKIELPDETILSGTVTKIGKIAVIPEPNQPGDPYLEMFVTIDGDKDLPEWTGAPVTVSITKLY